MDEQKRGASPVSIVTEVAIAGVLVILILATLNYFGILPLSHNFSFLKFLPENKSYNNLSTQQSVTPQPLYQKKLRTKAVVTPNSAERLLNNGEDYMYKPIPESFMKFNGQMRMDIEINSSIGNNKNEKSNSIILSNTKKYADTEYRGIIVSDTPKNGAWLLESRSRGKSDYFYLTKANSKENFFKVAIVIGAEGKAVSVLIPGEPPKEFNLRDSLYENGKLMGIVLQAAPQSEISLYSLYYQY